MSRRTDLAAPLSPYHPAVIAAELAQEIGFTRTFWEAWEAGFARFLAGHEREGLRGKALRDFARMCVLGERAS